MIGEGCVGAGDSGRSVSIGAVPGDDCVVASGECQLGVAFPCGGVERCAGDVTSGDNWGSFAVGLVAGVVPVVRESSSSALS